MAQYRTPLARVDRVSDPTKRAELHAARAIIQSVDTLLSQASQMAQRGGVRSADARIASARDSLHYAKIDLTDALTTYDPATDRRPE
jgi:hypothetical protein